MHMWTIGLSFFGAFIAVVTWLYWRRIARQCEVHIYVLLALGFLAVVLFAGVFVAEERYRQLNAATAQLESLSYLKVVDVDFLSNRIIIQRDNCRISYQVDPNGRLDSGIFWPLKTGTARNESKDCEKVNAYKMDRLLITEVQVSSVWRRAS